VITDSNDYGYKLHEPCHDWPDIPKINY
jgi:hypothetical protein